MSKRKKDIPSFMPDLWSQKVLSKFYDKMLIFPDTRSLLMKNLTLEIKKLSESGLTPEQIAEKIDPEMFYGNVFRDCKFEDNFGKRSGSILMNTYGVKILNPSGIGMLGVTK